MPQWGKSVQGWVNGWVRVNNQHSVFPGVTDDGGRNNRSGRNSASESSSAVAAPRHDNSGPMHAPHTHCVAEKTPLEGLINVAANLPPPMTGDGRTILDQRRKSQSTHVGGRSSMLRTSDIFLEQAESSDEGSRSPSALNCIGESIIKSSTVRELGNKSSGKRASTSGLHRTKSQSDMLKLKDAEKRSFSITYSTTEPTEEAGSVKNTVDAKQRRQQQQLQNQSPRRRLGTQPLSGSDRKVKEIKSVHHQTGAGAMASISKEDPYANEVESQKKGIIHASSPSSSVAQTKFYQLLHNQNLASQLPQIPIPNTPTYPAAKDTTGVYVNEAAFASQQYQIQMRMRQHPAQDQSQLSKQGESKKKDRRRQNDERMEPISASLAHQQTYHQYQPHQSLQVNQGAFVIPPLRSEELNSVPFYDRETNSSSQQCTGVNTSGRSALTVTVPLSLSSLAPFPHPNLDLSNVSRDFHTNGHATSVVDKSNWKCQNCEEMERQLVALHADLEYLRISSLQNEFLCSECETLPTNYPSTSSASRQTNISYKKRSKAFTKTSLDPDRLQESASLSEASQRLADVTTRHNKQIEHMSRETARWQNDMHLKLSKLSMICKDLNDESSLNKHEAKALVAQMSTVTDERNKMALELEILRARVELYEKEEMENSEIRRFFREKENEVLNMSDAAMNERDEVISDLTSRLQRALDTLELERHQLRQRRQIIFPTGRASSMIIGSEPTSADRRLSSIENVQSITELNNQLARAKEETKLVKFSLDSLRTDATRTEEAMQTKIDEMSKALRAAEENLAEKDIDRARLADS